MVQGNVQKLAVTCNSTSLQAPTFALPVTTTAFLSDCLAALIRIFLNLHLALKIIHLRKS